MPVPTVSKTLKRDQWVRSIERDPTPATFDRRNGTSFDIDVKLGNPSQSRKVTVAGLHEDIPDLECKIAMPLDEASPEAFRDTLAISDRKYRIIESQGMPGTGCYLLTLALET